MKRIMLAGCMVLIFCSSAFAAAWYAGGTLHKATGAQWLKGAPSNKVATTADWITATVAEQYHETIWADDQKLLKAATKDIGVCVNKIAESYGTMAAAEMALLCMVEFKKKHPEYAFFLTK